MVNSTDPQPRAVFQYLILLGLGVALLLASVVASLLVGAADVSLNDVWAGPMHPNAEATIIWQVRLPRVLAAIITGAGLAVAGASLQAVMENPLADPYILGISSGAAVGAALSTFLGATGAALFGGPVLAFVGAIISVFVVYRVAEVGGTAPPMRLLLAGIAFSSFAQAANALLIFLLPDAQQVRGLMFWLLGGFSGASWNRVALSAALVLPGVAALLLAARWQDLLLLGGEVALSLGLDVRRARRTLIVIAALITGALVAMVGAIGFIGLIVPHALRPFVGVQHRRLLPAVVVYGGLLMAVMDLLARTVLAPQEIPVGVLSGILGAPFFLLLLRKARYDRG